MSQLFTVNIGTSMGTNAREYGNNAKYAKTIQCIVLA